MTFLAVISLLALATWIVNEVHEYRRWRHGSDEEVRRRLSRVDILQEAEGYSDSELTPEHRLGMVASANSSDEATSGDECLWTSGSEERGS